MHLNFQGGLVDYRGAGHLINLISNAAQYSPGLLSSIQTKTPSRSPVADRHPPTLGSMVICFCTRRGAHIPSGPVEATISCPSMRCSERFAILAATLYATLT